MLAQQSMTDRSRVAACSPLSGVCCTEYSIWLRLSGLWLACIDAGWRVGRLGFEMCPKFGSSRFRLAPLDPRPSCYVVPPLSPCALTNPVHHLQHTTYIDDKFYCAVEDRLPWFAHNHHHPYAAVATSDMTTYASLSSMWLLCGVLVVVIITKDRMWR